MYKTETHLHTAEVSSCSHKRAAEMMEIYSKAGYKTIVVTDHFTPRYFRELGDISWDEKIAIFLSGYYRAKEAAKAYDMNVLMGAEICFEGIDGDYLAYGLTKEFLLTHPDLQKQKLSDFCNAAKEEGILVIHAHPYRDGYGKPSDEAIDGIEVYNSNPRHEDYNDKAYEYAKDRGIYMLAGSDAHRDEDTAQSGIVTDMEIKTIEDFVKTIKSGEYEIIA